MLTAFDILRLARDVTFRWMHELIDKLQSSDKADQVHNLQTRICNVAATCRATYDVDPAHLPFLFSSMDDIAVLVGCAIALHSHLPASVQNEPSSFKKLLARDHHLCEGGETSTKGLKESWPRERFGLGASPREAAGIERSN